MKKISFIIITLAVCLLLLLSSCSAQHNSSLQKQMDDSLFEEAEGYSQEYYTLNEETGYLGLTEADKKIVTQSEYTDANSGSLKQFSQAETESINSFYSLCDTMRRLELKELTELTGGGSEFAIKHVSDVKDGEKGKYVYAICDIAPFGEVVIYAFNDGGEGNYVWAYCADYDMATFEDVNNIKLLSNSYKDDLQYLCAMDLTHTTYSNSMIFTADGRTATLRYYSGFLDDKSDTSYNICYSKALQTFNMLEHLSEEDMPKVVLN